MRKRKILSIAAGILICLLFAGELSAQGTVPPSPPGEHGGSGDQEGRTAPVGGGTFFLIAMGAAYGAKKYFDSRNHTEKPSE